MSAAAAVDSQVLEGARTAIERFGWQGASLERIAAASGLSRATLHRRGVTRDLLLAHLSEEAVRLYRDAMWPSLTGTGSGAERLEEALEALCELIEQNLAVVRALNAHANAAVFHDQGQPEQMTGGVFAEPLQRLLQDGQSDGSVRPLDAREMSTVLFNLVSWTYIHLRDEHHWQPDRARRGTLEVALRGVVG